MTKRPMQERRHEIMQSPLTHRWLCVRIDREPEGDQPGVVTKIADVTDSVEAILAHDRQTRSTP